MTSRKNLLHSSSRQKMVLKM